MNIHEYMYHEYIHVNYIHINTHSRNRTCLTSYHYFSWILSFHKYLFGGCYAAWVTFHQVSPTREGFTKLLLSRVTFHQVSPTREGFTKLLLSR